MSENPPSVPRIKERDIDLTVYGNATGGGAVFARGMGEIGCGAATAHELATGHAERAALYHPDDGWVDLVSLNPLDDSQGLER